MIPEQESPTFIEGELIPYQKRHVMSPGLVEHGGSESLRDVLQVLRRRKNLIGLVVAGMLTLGILACVVMTKKYASTATIEITPEDDSPLSNNNNAAAPDADAIKADLETATKILQDDTLALAVIKSQDLTRVPPYKIEPGLMDYLEGSPLRKEQGLPLDQAPATRAALLKRFAKSLKVEAVPDTRLIQVTFLNPDAKIASLGANALVHAFIEDSLRRRHNSVSTASFWLSKELDDLKGKVEDSQQKLADYERQTGLGGIEMAQGAQGGGAGLVLPVRNVTLDKLATLNDQLTAAETNRISTEAVYKLVQTQDPEVVLGLGNLGIANGAAGAAVGEGGLQQLQAFRQQEVALRAEYANLATKYGENNPRLAQIKNQLDSVHQSAQGELANIGKRAQNSYLIAKGNEDAVRQEFNKQQGAANKLNDDTVHLQVLAQEALSNRTLYENLFSRLQEANIVAGVKATRVSIVDEGRIAAKPSKPNVPLYLLASLGGGLFFGLTAAFIKENLETTVQSPMDIELSTQMPVLAHIPDLESIGRRKISSAYMSPESSLSDAFSVLKTAILQQSTTGRVKTILVTSPLTGDGKTSVTYHLGLSLARQGAKVLLVDGDLRKPSLHLVCECDNSVGIRNLTSGALPLEKAVVPVSNKPGLFLLPAGTHPGWPDKLFTMKEFQSLLDKAKQDYDWVLIDTPPILVVADASILSAYADALLVVFRPGNMSRAALPHLATAIQRTRRKVLGCVLNAVNTGAPEYMMTY
jgi:capsular exopolysaccharide synthesis family protein